MAGFVLTSRSGDHVTGVVTWRDALSAGVSGQAVESSHEVRRLIPAELLVDTGSELRDGIPLASIFARVTRGLDCKNLIPHSLISFVAHALVGSRSEPVMHVTDAAAHGFLNLRTLDWHGEEVNGES